MDRCLDQLGECNWVAEANAILKRQIKTIVNYSALQLNQQTIKVTDGRSQQKQNQ